MSLQFIIDAYNIINHPAFSLQINKKIKDQKIALLELIRTKRLTGSLRNRLALIFDGYPNMQDAKSLRENNACVSIIFSRGVSADDCIRKIVENSGNPKNTVVVSDDKAIKFFVSSLGAHSVSVDEWLKRKGNLGQERSDLLKPELTYQEMQKINAELKDIWLK